jgi:sugar phosphate isomerase/epimerase
MLLRICSKYAIIAGMKYLQFARRNHGSSTSRNNRLWRYVLPGYGRIRWGEFIGTLRQIGYNGVLSIEHEDSAFPAEEGFIKAARYLNTLI